MHFMPIWTDTFVFDLAKSLLISEFSPLYKRTTLSSNLRDI